MQTFTDNCFAGSQVGQTSLQNMENNFASLKSMFSGTSQPPNAVAGMGWFDMTQNVMKQRDSANANWLGLMHGDVNQKLWVYRNTAMDGWAIDATPSDRVLAMKGGSTYVTGGVNAGSWTTANHTHPVSVNSHNHLFYEAGIITGSPPTAGSFFNSSGAVQTLVTNGGGIVGSGNLNAGKKWWGPTLRQTEWTAPNYTVSGVMLTDCWTANDNPSGTATSSGSASSWRPAASVGTLQYLDL